MLHYKKVTEMYNLIELASIRPKHIDSCTLKEMFLETKVLLINQVMRISQKKKTMRISMWQNDS
jgi:hypothetical protein